MAAVGIPVGAILLFGFIISLFQALFYGEAQLKKAPQVQRAEPETHLEKIINRISRFDIFTIGFLIFLAVFAYWVLPNIITYAGRVGLDTLIRYKWVFIPVAVVFIGMAVWIIYLRYLLAKKSIESQTEVNKYRLQLEMTQKSNPPLSLDYTPQTSDDRQAVGLDEDTVYDVKENKL